MERSTIVLLLAAVLSAYFIHEVSSACCYGRTVNYCGETTRFPPIFRCDNCEQAIFYCAKNRTTGCNVFGCRCSGGCLTKEDMPSTSMYNPGALPGAEPSPAEPAMIDRVKKMIDAFDNDRDGRLDMNEFGRFVGSDAVKSSQEKSVQEKSVQEMFSELDTDKNGQITLAEIDSEF